MPESSVVEIDKKILKSISLDSVTRVFDISLIVVFGFIYVFVIDSYFGESGKFLDLENYSRFFEEVATLGSIYYYEDLRLFALISSEPGWRFIVLLSSMYFSDPHDFFLTCSIFSIITFSLFVYYKTGRLYPLVFLLNPIVIDLVMSQIRSSVATSIFLLAILLSKLPLRLILFALAVSIHSSAAVLIFVYIYSAYIEKNNISSSRLVRLVFIISLAIVLSLALSVWRESLLTAVGDRRAIYQVAVSSTLYLVFWLVLGIYLAFTRLPAKIDRHAWMVSFVAILFLLAFLMSIFSTNGTRFVALGFPVLIALLALLPFLKRFSIFFMLTTYQVLQYYYWL